MIPRWRVDTRPVIEPALTVVGGTLAQNVATMGIFFIARAFIS